MSLNSSFKKNMLPTGICVGLVAAIVMGLFLPALDMIPAKPDTPLEDDAIREIRVLNVGEYASEMDSIVVPEQGSSAPGEPEESQPEESEPEETEEPEDAETEPEESEPEETEPRQTEPEETTPEETDPEDQEDGEEDEGNDDGNQGEEGGDALELDLAAVLTWYKYGTDPNTIACAPSGSAAKTINVAQLEDDTLRYSISLAGGDAGFVDITGVSLAEGDSAYREVSQNGSVQIRLPDGGGSRNYTFRVRAVLEKAGEEGETVQQEILFMFVLKCERNLDLDLELTWQPRGGAERTVVCAPDRTETFSVKNHNLTERVFGYTLELTGSLAEESEIISGQYTTASGQSSGELDTTGGTLILDAAPDADTETYHLTFTVRTPERDVMYRYKLLYQEELDVQLDFHWMEGGTVRRTATCDPGDYVTQRITSNQLSAGAVPYEMELTGSDGADGRILSVSYTSVAGGSGNLEPSGSLPLSMAEGTASNTYRITVTAMVKGQRVTFEVILYYSADVSLLMEYTITENGSAALRQISCENTRTKTAEPIYDDQLTDGVLRYTMHLTGSEEGRVSITSVSCYQSGSGRILTLTPEGEVVLLLKAGKTGENTFEVRAQDDSGNTYRFTVNIPYKHRGENNIHIQTNLTDGQEIINETKTNLTVQAWSEDAGGNILSYIPANGTDTKLLVQLDGQTLSYVSSSGAASEYDLYPANPEVGDTNTHILYIYAEDALGNYGELTLTLQGQRRESGMQVGKATIYVDMTSLGLGVVANLSYDVLADEPVSYVIAKAIMGMDTGEPFGKAANTLGWSGRYAGTLDNGFYLQSLTTGHTANALEGGVWPGSTEAEVLRAIDERFGRGTGLATLWRCLYRNGLNKSTGSGGSFGEFDYTSGSGWMYSVGGSTYYPGQSMSGVYLQDGDVLIVRFTLAYGWEVSGGTPGYGSTVGYCVSAVNGTIRISHRMETVTNPDGSTSNVCHCCGIVEDCAHETVSYIDLGDGTHIQYCAGCRREIGDPAEHAWVYTGADGDSNHHCEACGAAESHRWKEIEGSNTATCTEPGTRSVQCPICNRVKEEETAPKGHTLDNQWLVTAQEHYEKCSTCNEIANRGRHQYKHITYMENGVQKEDYECQICHAFHVDECDGTLTEKTATCQKITWHCGSCGYDMEKEGIFEENHNYVDGSCEFCGEPDPDGGTEPTEPAPTEPEPTEPAPTEPEPTEPEPTEPEPTEPEPTEPEPTEPEPTEPEPTDPTPTEPVPTEPAPTEPAPTEPAPTEPAPTEPEPTEPAPTQPPPTDPLPTDPPEDDTGTEPAADRQPKMNDIADWRNIYESQTRKNPAGDRKGRCRQK